MQHVARQVTSRREAKRLALSLFWNVRAEFSRRGLALHCAQWQCICNVPALFGLMGLTHRGKVAAIGALMPLLCHEHGCICIAAYCILSQHTLL